MVKFIHTSDWHLGMQAHFLPEEARARFAQGRFDAVERIAEIAAEEECAFVVVAGDVFDSNHVDRAAVAKALEALKSFTIPVFLLPGNHDPLDPSSIYLTEAWASGKSDLITVIDEPAAITVPGADGVEVVGSPWLTKHQLDDPAAECYEVATSGDGALRIVVAHGTVDTLSPDPDNPALVGVGRMREAIEEERAHYVALGDRHSVTEVEDTDARAHYSGTPVATDYREDTPNQALVVTLNEGTCAVEARQVGDWTFEDYQRDLNDEDDVEALAQLLAGVESKSTAVVTLALRGTLSLAANRRLEEALDESRLTFASLDAREKRSDLVVAPDEADLDALAVSGYVRETLDDLSEQATGVGEEAVVARGALNLLYRLARPSEAA